MKILDEKLKFKRINKNLIIIIFIISLIPILWISFYNHPSADDYNYTVNTARAFAEGGLGNIFSSICQTVKTFYYTWQGTFSGIALMSLQPSAINDNLYFLSTFILLFTFIISNYLLIAYVFTKALKLDFNKTLSIILITLFIVIQRIPSAVQGLYWWNGSIYYTFFYSLFLIEIYLFLKYYNEKKKKYLIYIIPLLSFFISGGNYVIALLQLIMLSLVYLYYWIFKKIKLSLIGISFLTGIIGLAISILAPGNALRGQELVGMGPITSILASFYGAVMYISKWTDLITIIYFIFISILFYGVYSKTNYNFKYPLLVSLITYAVFSASFTPGLYAMGHLSDGRMLNIIYYSYYWFIGINIFYWIGWFRLKILNNFKEKKPLSFEKEKRIAIIVLVVIFGGLIIVDHANFLSYYTAKSLINGEAQTYDKEFRERLKLYNDDNIKDVITKPFSVYPKALYFDDITTDPNDWRNQSVAWRYNKTSVGLTQE